MSKIDKRLDEILLKYSSEVFDADYEGNDEKRENAHKKAKSQILTHYISRQEVLDAIDKARVINHAACGINGTHNDECKVQTKLRAEIKKELGLLDE